MNLKLVQSNFLFHNHASVLLIFVVFSFFISCHEKRLGLIYILWWTKSNEYYIEAGQEPFTIRNCTFQNCFLTKDRSYLSNLLDFDVLLFNVMYIHLRKYKLPSIRSQTQLYVLVALEPSPYYPITPQFNGIFNMTWSFKLISDIVYPYIIIRNKQGEIIGPRKDMNWEYHVKDMPPTNNDTISQLRYKNTAAAAIVSNCLAKNDRLEFIRSLKEELMQYGEEVDVYGNCAIDGLSCKRLPYEKNGLISKCDSKVEADYYFYLAFENSFCEDYVTEKVLHGLNHFAVPVVYGDANYSSFLPDGIYMNARTLGVKILAEEMDNIIKEPQRYIDFFKWHGYYTFHDTYGYKEHDTHLVCNICAVLNARIQSKRRTVYKHIDKWWNGFDAHNESTTNSTVSALPSEGRDQINSSMLNYIILNEYEILFKNNDLL